MRTGRARARIGDRDVDLKPGDVFLVPKNTVHAARAYGEEPFITVVEHAPATKHVLGSNEFRVWCRVDERTGRVLAIGVLDNMVKGAAGQGIQAFNVLHGLPETTALLQLPLAP